jgi:hypothetical protein
LDPLQIGACVRYNPRVAPKKLLLRIVIAVFFFFFAGLFVSLFYSFFVAIFRHKNEKRKRKRGEGCESYKMFSSKKAQIRHILRWDFFNRQI